MKSEIRTAAEGLKELCLERAILPAEKVEARLEAHTPEECSCLNIELGTLDVVTHEGNDTGYGRGTARFETSPGSENFCAAS